MKLRIALLSLAGIFMLASCATTAQMGSYMAFQDGIYSKPVNYYEQPAPQRILTEDDFRQMAANRINIPDSCNVTINVYEQDNSYFDPWLGSYYYRPWGYTSWYYSPWHYNSWYYDPWCYDPWYYDPWGYGFYGYYGYYGYHYHHHHYHDYDYWFGHHGTPSGHVYTHRPGAASAGTTRPSSTGGSARPSVGGGSVGGGTYRSGSSSVPARVSGSTARPSSVRSAAPARSTSDAVRGSYSPSRSSGSSSSYGSGSSYGGGSRSSSYGGSSSHSSGGGSHSSGGGSHSSSGSSHSSGGRR